MPEAANTKVFVAEDDASVLELLRVRLELAGYHTFYARDGHRAVEAIRNVAPHVIVLDIGLPHLDGFGVLQSLRADRRFKDTPVLMLTARHAQSDVQRSLACGAQDYLTKPFDDKVFLARVGRLAGLSSNRPASVSNQVFL